MRDLDAVLDHEEPLPHPACEQVQARRRIISAASSCVGAMSPGQWVYQVRGHHGGRTERVASVNSPPCRSLRCPRCSTLRTQVRHRASSEKCQQATRSAICT